MRAKKKADGGGPQAGKSKEKYIYIDCIKYADIPVRHFIFYVSSVKPGNWKFFGFQFGF